MKTIKILLVLVILFLSIACSEPPEITEIATSEGEINVMVDPPGADQYQCLTVYHEGRRLQLDYYTAG